MYFFNVLNGFAIFNCRDTFVRFLSLVSGVPYRQMMKLIIDGRFKIAPGMLSRYNNRTKILKPIFLVKLAGAKDRNGISALSVYDLIKKDMQVFLKS
jgi:hypothetical protein